MSKKILLTAPLIAALVSVAALNGAAPTQAQATPPGSGYYIEIDNLTITGIVSPYAPTQMLAADLSYPTMAEDGTIMATTTATASAPVTCTQFGAVNSSTGTSTTCPTPLIAPSSTSSVYYLPYTIQIDPTTQILLNDNTPTMLGDFAPGDTVDVYGYYNSADDSIDAETVRDLSKPVVGIPPVTNLEPDLTPTSTAIAIATSSEALTELQNYIGEVATLIAQLEGELSSGVVPASATASSTALPTIPATVY